jgi:hypothetical protein
MDLLWLHNGLLYCDTGPVVESASEPSRAVKLAQGAFSSTLKPLGQRSEIDLLWVLHLGEER